MIRLVKKKDAVAIFDLVQSFRGDTPWNEAMVKEVIDSSEVVAVVYEEDNSVVAFACLHLIDKEAELDGIATQENFRKKGIATQLVQYLLEAAKKSCAEVVFLEVGTDNIAAINLYKKFGFTIVRTRKNYYGKGKNAFVLIKEL
ncbi:MAG: ribosomal protein S18-alanine N-acetyltransferase [Firmicutes bacterium]|nr:ribosomal protein S18-alanine N-acetyltransferase [Bacillota bacterium]